jgi:hypothetical protein
MSTYCHSGVRLTLFFTRDPTTLMLALHSKALNAGIIEQIVDSRI